MSCFDRHPQARVIDIVGNLINVFENSYFKKTSVKKLIANKCNLCFKRVTFRHVAINAKRGLKKELNRLRNEEKRV